MSCALGIQQLKKINKILKMREGVAKSYYKKLSNNKDISLPFVHKDNGESWFVFVIQLNKRVDRTKVIEILKERGIATNIYFPSIHLQEFYKKEFGYKEGDFPITEEISKRTLALPFFSELTQKEISYVCQNLEQAINLSKK